jgi:hypothetical protein
VCLGGLLPHLEELVNEPGGSAGPTRSVTLSSWMTAMYPRLVDLTPRHMHTVGLAWQFDQLESLQIRPELAQYHEYSGAPGVAAEHPQERTVEGNIRSSRTLVGADRPLMLGEFGYSTQSDPSHPDANAQVQRQRYDDVLRGAQAAGATGVYNGNSFTFVPHGWGRSNKRLESSLPMDH